MKNEVQRAEINMASIRVDGGFAGLLFAIGSATVFMVGIPAIRFLLPASAALGCLIAIGLHYWRR